MCKLSREFAGGWPPGNTSTVCRISPWAPFRRDSLRIEKKPASTFGLTLQDITQITSPPTGTDDQDRTPKPMPPNHGQEYGAAQHAATQPYPTPIRTTVMPRLILRNARSSNAKMRTKWMNGTRQSADTEAYRQTGHRSREIGKCVIAIASGCISKDDGTCHEERNHARNPPNRRRKTESIPDRKNKARHRATHEYQVQRNERDCGSWKKAAA